MHLALAVQMYVYSAYNKIYFKIISAGHEYKSRASMQRCAVRWRTRAPLIGSPLIIRISLNGPTNHYFRRCTKA